MNIEKSNPILLFDGICNLCNEVVKAVIQRDTKRVFKFASLQSDIGSRLIKENGNITPNIDTVVLVKDGQLLIKSDAILEVLRTLGGLYLFMMVFKIIPRALRDRFYDWIAGNRYDWFGRRDSCMIPTPELMDRFLN